MINVLFIFILVFGTVSSYNSIESLFQLNVIYKEESSSQSIQILDFDSRVILYQFNGYGKEFTVDEHMILLQSKRYSVIVRDGLRDHWPVGSYFTITAESIFPILEGSCDFGGYQEYSFYPSIPIPLFSNWLYYDTFEPRWFEENFDDSDWNLKHGGYPMYFNTRYYRFHAMVDMDALQYDSSLLIALHGRNTSSVYLNGKTIFSNINTTLARQESHVSSIEDFFLYTIPITSLKSSTLVVAVQSDSQTVIPIEDGFDLSIMLLPASSNRAMSSQYSSSHSIDYYRNPLQLAFDANRGSYWKVRGNEADLVIVFPQRYEFVNTLTLTSSNDKSSTPTSIQIKGCTNAFCQIVGVVDSIAWHGTYETKSFFFNELNESFTRVELALSNKKDEIQVSEITLSASNQSCTLVYPSSTLTFMHHTSFSVTPVFSTYTAFSIEPTLPDGVHLHSNSGTIEGYASASPEQQYTVEATSLVSSQRVKTVISLQILGCDDPLEQIVKIEHASRLWSETEHWDLSKADGTMLFSKQGMRCGKNEITEIYYFCLSPGEYTVTQQTKEHEGIPLGYVSISFFQPSLKDGSFIPLAILPFSYNSSPFVFSTTYLPSEDSEWKVNTNYHPDWNWQSIDYNDSTWSLVSLQSLPSKNTIRLRKWIDLHPKEMESAIIHISSDCGVSMYWNGYYTFERYTEMRSGVTFQLTSDIIQEGDNLVAIRLYCETSAPSLLFRIQHLITSSYSLSARTVTVESYGTLPPSTPSNVMDNNVLSDWVGELKGDEVALKFTFVSEVMQTINSFCITNSLTEKNADPSAWIFSGKMMDNKWYTIASYENVFFQSSGERRCFVVRSEYRNKLFSAVQLIFQRHFVQSRVAISEVQFYSAAFKNKEISPFQYGQSTIDVIREIDFPSIATPSIYYSNYWSYGLPEGLYLDKMNGRIMGKIITQKEQITVKVFALTIDSQSVSTELTLRLKQCENDFSFIEIAFDAIDDIFNYLSFLLYRASETHPIATVSVSPFPGTSASSYLFCLEKGSYKLQFIDKTNAGFINAMYSLRVDRLQVQTGMFNSGFSSFQFTFSAGFFFPPHSLWYYSVDNSEPPPNWYTSIDPVHETWDIAYPGAFPVPQGRAQYFKTVVELTTTSYHLQHHVSFILRFFVKGGAILYLNAKEVLRHALPEGTITHTTQPLSSFDDWTELKVTIPIQFAFTTEEVIPIAVELHDMVPQPTSSFSLSITLQTDDSLCQVSPQISYYNVPEVENPDQIYDYQYYNKVLLKDNNKDVEVILDLQQREYVYISKFCLFSGNTAGEHPVSLSFQGGVLHSQSNYTEWREIYATSDIHFVRNVYGESHCFHFFNDQLYGLFRFVLTGMKQKTNMEIAEVSFYSKRLDGYCEISVNGTTTQTPNQTWKKLPCPHLYFGNQFIFCNNGNWTESVDHCMPIKPQGFQYPQRMYIVRRGSSITIRPDVIGAELVFSIDYIPKGMTFDSRTGILEGIYKEQQPTMSFTVVVSNQGGEQQTSFGIYTINSHEGLFLLIAILSVAILVCLVLYVNQLIQRKGNSKKRAEQSHLHTNELPENLISLLV